MNIILFETRKYTLKLIINSQFIIALGSYIYDPEGTASFNMVFVYIYLMV